MLLQSQLFLNDRMLESAAASDPAHIILGANGPHVRRIQLALIQTDGAKIAVDGKYGPATAAAVAAFKEKRKVTNHQGKIDAIVGKKTIATLHREMRAKEKANGGGVRLGFSVRGAAGFPIPQTRLGRNLDNRKVATIIREKLALSSGPSRQDRLSNAFDLISDDRERTHPGDPEFAAAEHYLFSRWIINVTRSLGFPFVALASFSYFVFKVLIPASDLLRFGKGPVTRASLDEQRWSKAGMQDGFLLDLNSEARSDPGVPPFTRIP